MPPLVLPVMGTPWPSIPLILEEQQAGVCAKWWVLSALWHPAPLLLVTGRARPQECGRCHWAGTQG